MAFPSPSEKQGRILWVSLTALAIGILLALIGLLLWGFGWVLNQLSAVLLPLAIAGIIAYLLDPVVDFMETKGVGRIRAILSVFLLAVMLLLILLTTVVPQVVRETGALIRQLPTYTQTLEEKLKRWMKDPPFGIQLPQSWRTTPEPTNTLSKASPTNLPLISPEAGDTNILQSTEREPVSKGFMESEAFEKFVRWVASVLPEIYGWLIDQVSKVASWVGLLIGLALVPVYVFYFLLEKSGIQQSWTNYLPIQESRIKEEVVFVIRAINDYLILFFRGQILVALCDGVLYTAGLLALGLNYAFLLGAIAGLLSIVPFLGFVISIVPALALAAVQFGDWWHPLLVLGVFALVQLVEGLVISPKIMGDRVGLHPLTIIIAVMVGTTLMGGIIGGILAIPLTAALRVLMFRYVWKKSGAPERDNSVHSKRKGRAAAG
jgi:predicted PurR-regulated permease PerM